MMLFNMFFIPLYFLPPVYQSLKINSKDVLSYSDKMLGIGLQIGFTSFVLVQVPTICKGLNYWDYLCFFLGGLWFNGEVLDMYRGNIWRVFSTKVVPLFFLFYSPLLFVLSLFRTREEISVLLVVIVWLITHLIYTRKIYPKIL